MGNNWFIADLHLMHPGIIDHCSRPISQELHDEWLIDRINQRVSSKDTLYILGDVTMSNRVNTERLIKKINGKKHLIRGNHDKNLKNSTVFESVSLIKNITKKVLTKKIEIILCHYPLASWENRVEGSYHFHGHTHGRHINGGLSYDVGVDNNDYYPMLLEEIIYLIKKIK